MYVLHVDDEPVTELFSEGQYVEIPAGEPFEIDDNLGKALMSRKSFTGIVEVFVTKTKTGLGFDTDDAIQRATETLKQQEISQVHEWVKNTIEDRISKGLPAFAPHARLKRILAKHNIDLQRDFGFTPISDVLQQKFDAGAITQQDLQRHVELEAKVQAEKERNDALQAQVKELLDIVRGLRGNADDKKAEQVADSKLKKADAEAKATPKDAGDKATPKGKHVAEL